MPFYWRLNTAPEPFPGIPARLPIKVVADSDYDYLKFVPTRDQWRSIDAAYRQNENIGFLNPESGQMQTYGLSVNSFILNELQRAQPRLVVEIGCGAGFTIQHLKQHGFDVLGIDPSEYSLHWSERLNFRLVNDYFREGLLDERPDFIYCNDVFEHIPNVQEFAATVHKCLAADGLFCFATTNSTRSISLGDISMLEHQHVNMFTDRSITLILDAAGFTDIQVCGGTYGNTFHVTAIKRGDTAAEHRTPPVDSRQPPSCAGYFERAAKSINAFERYYYHSDMPPNCYVPLRSIPYLACVGDFGHARIFDSNEAWNNKYIDGYTSPIEGIDAISYTAGRRFFVASMTFFKEIEATLIAKGYPEGTVQSIASLT